MTLLFSLFKFIARFRLTHAKYFASASHLSQNLKVLNCFTVRLTAATTYRFIGISQYMANKY